MIVIATIADLVEPFRARWFGWDRANSFASNGFECVEDFKDEILVDIRKCGGSSPDVYRALDSLKDFLIVSK